MQSLNHPLPQSLNARNTSRIFVAITVAYASWVVYGSLVPFDWQAVPPADVASIISRLRLTPIDVGGRADVASNVLLFVPLGFCLAAATVQPFRGRHASSLKPQAFKYPFGAVVACAALSGAIEFGQIFLASRIASLNDIVVDTAGAAAGAGLWLALGRDVTAVLRWVRRRTGPLPPMQWLLAAYAAVLAIAWLLPLDLTISLPEIEEKYWGGGVTMWAFAEDSVMAHNRAGVATMVLQGVPLGVLALIGATPRGTRRSIVAGLAVAAAGIFALFAAQLVVYSRQTDVSTFILLFMGAMVGLLCAAMASRQQPLAVVLPGVRLGWLAVWVLAVMIWSWFPFDFALDHSLIRWRMFTTSAVPLVDYFERPSPFTVLSWIGLFVLAAALPIALAKRPGRHKRHLPRLRQAAALAATAAFFAGLSVSRLMLESRPPDATEPLVGVLGIAAGGWAAGRIHANRPVSQTR